MKHEPAAEWTAAMDAIIQRRKNRRATLGEFLVSLLCVAIITASIFTFLVAIFAGVDR